MFASVRNTASLLLLAGMLAYCGAGPAIFNEQTEGWEPLKLTVQSEYMPKPTNSWKEAGTDIFVGISHYRDARCSETLKNLFTKAEFPDRVYVGVIEHIHMEEDHLNCLADYCRATGQGSLESGRCPHAKQVRLLDVSFKDARGPGVSRYMQQRLHDGEEFCLQIDAHSDVVPHWDSAMLQTWAATGNEYAVLSTHPPDLAELTLPQEEVNHVCQAGFAGNGLPRNLLPRRVRSLSAPLLAPLWSAAFSFSKCHAVEKAPYDPNLPYIFDGEEFLQMAKLWTRGYDVYSPHKLLVVHDNVGKMRGYNKPTPVRGSSLSSEREWATNGQTAEYKRLMYDEAVTRVKTILDMEGGLQASAETLATLQRYGLGSRRTLDDFLRFTGVDTRQSILFADACLPRKWVPFVADSEPRLADEDAWGMAAEVFSAGGAAVPIIAGGNVEVVMAPAVAATADIATVGAGKPALPVETPVRSVRRQNPLEQYPFLWGLFLPVDEALEGVVTTIRRHNPTADSRTAALRVIKLCLLLLPMLLVLVFVAIMTAIGNSMSSIFGWEEDVPMAAISKNKLWDDEDDMAKRV